MSKENIGTDLLVEDGYLSQAAEQNLVNAQMIIPVPVPTAPLLHNAEILISSFDGSCGDDRSNPVRHHLRLLRG